MIAWLDIETTGTDEVLDPILEVGIAVTGEDYPFEVVDTISVVVAQPDGAWQRRLEADDYVRQMHLDNGLAVDVRAATEDGGPLPGVAQDMLIGFLDQHEPKARRMKLAGSGVGHFDRRFLHAQMPLLEARFHYSNIDVGVIRRTMELIGRADLVPLPEQTRVVADFRQGSKDTLIPHRGLDDALAHLEEFRRYCATFLAIPAHDAPFVP